MFATLQRDLQQKYKWLTELRAHSDDASAILNSMTSETEQEAPGNSDEVCQRLRLQIIVSSYKPTEQTLMLTELGTWAKGNKLQLEPLFLTEQEAIQFSVFDSSDTLSPYDLLRYYRKQSTYPQSAKKQLKRAMDEILRMLRGLEQEFPTSGLHAWNIGLRLETLYHQIVSWGLALSDREYTRSDEDWTFFVEQFKYGQVGLSHPSFLNFPLQLQAFLQRHQKLAALTPKTYGDNDLELEQLIIPLERATRAVRNAGIEQLSTPAERQRGIQIAWWSIMSLSVLCICALLYVSYATQKSYQGAVTLPNGAKIGGITGSYYKGRKFESFLRSRTDKVMNMSWKKSPGPGIPSDHFSVRWTGYVHAPTVGVYRFCGQFDDGAKMWVSSRMIFKDWRGGSKRTRCKKLSLQKGWHKLKVELFEHSGPASIKLRWKRPNDKRLHVIPSKSLCCQK